MECCVVISVAMLIICILLALFLRCRTKPVDRIPPCPMRPLPLVGHLLYLKQDFRVQFKEWRERCGDLFSIYMGSKLLVVLNGYHVIHKTLVSMADDFSDRPVMVFDTLMGYEGKGIVFSSGPTWREHRTVVIKIFRLLHRGNDTLAARITQEVSHFVCYLDNCDGQPIDICPTLTSSVANIICSILSGQRFDYDDVKFKNMIGGIQKVILSSQQVTMMISCFPFLNYLPFDILGYKRLRKLMKDVYEEFQHLIDSTRRQDLQDNFIASYLKERDIRMESCDGNTTMNDTNLLKVVSDLFIAAAETTSNTIAWFVLYMLNYPDAQKKIFNEICEQVGTDRPPGLVDRPKLIYLTAAIMETQRLASISPVSIARTCSRDVIVDGRLIPKGTLIAPNLDSVLHDEKLWGDDVSLFRPERFIDCQGLLMCPAEFIPFGIGRRMCPGETIAKLELYFYISTMVQSFQFLPARMGHPPTLDYVLGLTANPAPFLVRVVRRHRNNVDKV